MNEARVNYVLLSSTVGEWQRTRDIYRAQKRKKVETHRRMLIFTYTFWFCIIPLLSH